MSARPYEIRYCEVCSKPIKRPYHLSIVRYSVRRYCCKRCRNEGFRGHTSKPDIAPDGGMTFVEIAKRLGCSRAQVQKIYAEASLKFVRRARQLGLTSNV